MCHDDDHQPDTQRRYRRWRGPQPTPGEEQIANAPDDLFPLAPVSEAPAGQVRADWAAVRGGG